SWDWLLGWSEVNLSLGLPIPVAVALVLNVLCTLTAVPVHFPSDVWRPEPPWQAIAGFFRDAVRVLRDEDARLSLIGLSCFLAVVTAGSGALVMYTLDPSYPGSSGDLIEALGVVTVGVALGSLIASLQGHPRRVLGWVPLGTTGVLVAVAWATSRMDLGWPCFLMGVATGV